MAGLFSWNHFNNLTIKTLHKGTNIWIYCHVVLIAHFQQLTFGISDCLSALSHKREYFLRFFNKIKTTWVVPEYFYQTQEVIRPPFLGKPVKLFCWLSTFLDSFIVKENSRRKQQISRNPCSFDCIIDTGSITWNTFTNLFYTWTQNTTIFFQQIVPSGFEVLLLSWLSMVTGL